MSVRCWPLVTLRVRISQDTDLAGEMSLLCDIQSSRRGLTSHGQLAVSLDPRGARLRPQRGASIGRTGPDRTEPSRAALQFLHLGWMKRVEETKLQKLDWIPRSTVLLKKPTDAELVKNFPVFCGIRMFVTLADTTFYPKPLVHNVTYYFQKIHFILSCHLCLRHPHDIFPIKIYVFPLPPCVIHILLIYVQECCQLEMAYIHQRVSN